MKKNKVILIGIFLIAMFFGITYFIENKQSNFKNAELKSKSKKKLSHQMEVASDKDSILYFNPSKKEVSVGENFSLDVMINPGKNEVEASSIHIIFNKDKLRLDSINPSDKFKLVLSESVIDNDKGTASIDVAIPISEPSNSEVSKIITLDFYALESVANSEISYAPTSQVAAKGEPKDVVKRKEKFFVTIK